MFYFLEAIKKARTHVVDLTTCLQVMRRLCTNRKSCGVLFCFVNRMSFPSVESLPKAEGINVFFFVDLPRFCVVITQQLFVNLQQTGNVFKNMWCLFCLKLFLITKLRATCMVVSVIGCNYSYLEIEKHKCSSSSFTWVLHSFGFMLCVWKSSVPPTLPKRY